MYEGIESDLDAIAKIADKCPERYRVQAFDQLLRLHLSSRQPMSGIPRAPGAATGAEPSVTRLTTLPEFAQRIQPTPGIEHVIVAGYWLETYGGKKEGFTSSDLLECFRQMRYNPTNPHDPISRARRSGLLIDQDGVLLLSNTALQDIRTKLKGAPA